MPMVVLEQKTEIRAGLVARMTTAFPMLQQLNRMRKKSFFPSFRAKRGIPLRSKPRKRGIPRHAACLGTTRFEFFRSLQSHNAQRFQRCHTDPSRWAAPDAAISAIPQYTPLAACADRPAEPHRYDKISRGGASVRFPTPCDF